jgi:hypothetical protein
VSMWHGPRSFPCIRLAPRLPSVRHVPSMPVGWKISPAFSLFISLLPFPSSVIATDGGFAESKVGQVRICQYLRTGRMKDLAALIPLAMGMGALTQGPRSPAGRCRSMLAKAAPQN